MSPGEGEQREEEIRFMPRKGAKTAGGTSMPELVIKLIDKFIEESARNPLQPKLSRAKVIENGVFLFLLKKGFLEKWLAEYQYSDDDIDTIKQYLQEECESPGEQR